MEHYSPQEPTNDAEKAQITGNLMQFKLAEKGGEELLDFIDKHGLQFRQALDAHPEYLEQFESDPDGVIEELSKIVYH